MRWLLFAAVGFVFWLGLWRVELTDSTVVRISRLTGAIVLTPLPSQVESENTGGGREDKGERESVCTLLYLGKVNRISSPMPEHCSGCGVTRRRDAEYVG